MQPHVQARPWDSFDAYLFDIDGTLLNCTDAVHYFAFCEALTGIAGRPLNLDGVVAHGNVDVGILRDALTLAGVPDAEWRPRIGEICSQMGRFVEANQGDLRITVLPGVHAVLDHLRQKGATLGVGTGNLAAIGSLKLKTAGLLDYFTVGGWSDQFEHRPDMIRNAIRLIREVTHPEASICVLGDTPSDIAAAHANGLPAIAVAAGIFTPQQLAEAKPELLLHSLTDLFA